MHQIDNAERDTQDQEPEPVDERGPEYFMTQVEQEDANQPSEKEDPFEEQAVEEEKVSRPQSQNSSVTNQNFQKRPPSYKISKKEGVPFFAMNPVGPSESKIASALSRDLANRNLADRIGPKAL